MAWFSTSRAASRHLQGAWNDAAACKRWQLQMLGQAGKPAEHTRDAGMRPWQAAQGRSMARQAARAGGIQSCSSAPQQGDMATLPAHMLALSLMFNPSCSAMTGSWLYRPSSDRFLQGKNCGPGPGQEPQEPQIQSAQHRQPTGAEGTHRLQLHAAQCRQLDRGHGWSSVIAGDAAVCLGCHGPIVSLREVHSPQDLCVCIPSIEGACCEGDSPHAHLNVGHHRDAVPSEAQICQPGMLGVQDGDLCRAAAATWLRRWWHTSTRAAVLRLGGPTAS